MTADIGADELRARHMLLVRGVGPDALPGTVPPPPAYPPSAGQPVTWWTTPAQPAAEPAPPAWNWAWLRPAYNGTALAAGVAAAPLTIRALHIAGDQYGIALAAVGLAYALDRARRWWITRAALWAATVALVADLPAARHALAYLTGAAS